MNTGVLEIADVKLSIGYIDYAEISVEFELEGVYDMRGGYAEYYNEVLVGEAFGYIALDKDIDVIALWVDGEEVELELTTELRYEIDNCLLGLDVHPEDLIQ